MKNRYSKYLRTILLCVDIIIINLVTYFFLKNQPVDKSFYLFISFFWLISSLSIKYYQIQRYTGFLKLLRLITTQLAVFTLGYFAYFGVYNEGTYIHNQLNTLATITIIISVFKIVVYLALKFYRKFGNNYRNVVFIGLDETSKKVSKLFLNKKELGYRYKGFFEDSPSENQGYLGTINEVAKYVEANIIHEIYIALSVLKKKTINDLIKFSAEQNITVKLIPNSHELYSKKQKMVFYDDAFSVLIVKKLPFDYPENHYIKRAFDIVFSFFAIILVMSWLTPILWVLIKLESKGPLFFKQEREGLNGEKFLCYKFRSMRKNKLADKIHATKNDSRVTKIGKFIRKTSIDELPQFFNVFLGDMSVVGPRPHMESLALEYQRDVDNYIERHAVKPGITGLAQVSGYRGEIKKKSDIKNRIRFDVFYIENWSFLFDIKIIIKTIFNIFKGEENAY